MSWKRFLHKYITQRGACSLKVFVIKQNILFTPFGRHNAKLIQYMAVQVSSENEWNFQDVNLTVNIFIFQLWIDAYRLKPVRAHFNMKIGELPIARVSRDVKWNTDRTRCILEHMNGHRIKKRIISRVDNIRTPLHCTRIDPTTADCTRKKRKGDFNNWEIKRKDRTDEETTDLSAKRIAHIKRGVDDQLPR